MRTYGLFSTGTTEQKKVARGGNKAIRVAIDKATKQAKSDWKKGEGSLDANITLAAETLILHVKPVLLKYSEAGADDTEPREIISQELCEKLGVFVSSRF